MNITNVLLVFQISIVSFATGQTALPVESPADPERGRDGFWFSAGLGDGFVEQSSDVGGEKRTGHVALAILCGYAFTRSVMVGIELRAWAYESYNLHDPSVGENINELSVILQAHPLRNNRFFVNGGVGLSRYTNNHPNEYGGTGYAFVLGTGYDIPVSDSYAISMFLNYSRGSFEDTEVEVLDIDVATGTRKYYTIYPYPHDRKYDVIDVVLAFTIF